jgi:hypothetical protein
MRFASLKNVLTLATFASAIVIRVYHAGEEARGWLPRVSCYFFELSDIIEVQTATTFPQPDAQIVVRKRPWRPERIGSREGLLAPFSSDRASSNATKRRNDSNGGSELM